MTDLSNSTTDALEMGVATRTRLDQTWKELEMTWHRQEKSNVNKYEKGASVLFCD